MSYTPGPWRENGEIVWSDFGEGYVIASLDDPDSRDDARLIAAAPELLEALHVIRITGPARERDIANAAIAKATGEQS